MGVMFPKCPPVPRRGYFIKEDGTAWAMGRNDFGQLGNADTADQSTPAIVFGWEENASVSVARFVSNGLVTLGNAIYCVGGYTSSNVYKLLEKYDHQTGQWENLQSMTESREGLASAVLDGKIYALGGVGFASSEIYDPVVNSWSVGPNLPEVIHRACAITYNNRLFLMGGQRADNAYLDQVLEFNSTSNQWITRSPMPNVGSGHKLIVFQNAVWAIGVSPDSSFAKVDRYVPETDTWFSMPDMITGRAWGVTWVLGDRLYVGGGSNGSYLKSIESYDPVTNQWQEVGELPQSSYASGFAQLGNKLFLVGGGVSTGVYSNKLYVSDMQAVREIRGNSSTGHTLLVRADNSFGAMGQNNYGQLGDNSLADKSYPVSLMNTYDVVMTSGTGGSATGAGIYYAGAQVTIGASPSPGYLFGNWSGDFSSTDANDSFIINADYAIAASFSQDTEDDDDDGLNNYYELAVLGSNPLSGDTDGDGFSDLDENATGLDPTVANTALYNHLSNLVELARSEGNATGYQAGLSDGNASGILYVQNNKTLYDLYTQEEANSSANERYADGVTEGNASGIAWASQNWSLYSLYTGEEKNASASTQYSLGLTEGNTTGYAQGLLDGNASGIAWGQANRTDYHFYTGGEVNSSAEAEYTLGYSEGNTTGYAQGLPDGNVSGVDYAFEQRADYDLFTQVEINASADTQYNTGYAEGNASGYSRGFSEGNATAVSLGMEQPETANLFTEEENIVTKQESVTRGFSSVQADLAREGLSLKAYYERIKDLQVPHLSDWHYHSTMGWLWTDRETFPFIYRAQSETHTGRWLYFSNRKEHRATPLYDYALGEWSMIPGSL
jgi:N-acetylneuraminic acid mutarotase